MEQGRAWGGGDSVWSLQGRGSLQASAPPCPPTRVSFFCGVSCVPPLVMCSLRFSKIRGLVPRLTAPPPVPSI